MNTDRAKVSTKRRTYTNPALEAADLFGQYPPRL